MCRMSQQLDLSGVLLLVRGHGVWSPKAAKSECPPQHVPLGDTSAGPAVVTVGSSSSKAAPVSFHVCSPEAIH